MKTDTQTDSTVTDTDTAVTVSEETTNLPPLPVSTPIKAPKAPKAKKGAKGSKKGAKGAKGSKKGAKALKRVGAANKPSTGQSAPPEALAVGDLNGKELQLLTHLNGTGEGLRETMTIPEMVPVFVSSAHAKKRANSWVRNQLRRLFTGGFVEKMGRGAYRVTEAGRKRLVRASA